MKSRLRRWWGLRKPLTYKSRLLIYSLLLGVFPIFLLGTISSRLMSQSIQAEVNSNHQVILRQLGDRIDDMLQGLDRTSVQLADSQAIKQSLMSGLGNDQQQLSQNMINTMMNALSNGTIPLKMSLYYTRFSTMYSSQYGIVRDIEYPYNEIVRTAQSQFASSLVVSLNSYPNIGDMFFVRAVPLHSTDPLGFLIVQLDKESLRLFLDNLELGGGRKVMIVDDRGAIVAKQEVVGVGERLQPADELYPFWEAGYPYSGTVKLDSVQYNVSAIPSSVRDWTYIALTPVSELSAKADNILRITWTIILGMLLVWMIAAAVVARRMYRPIEQIAEKFSPPSKVKQNKDMLQMIDTMLEQMTDRNARLQLELDGHKPYTKEMIVQHLLTGGSTRNEAQIATTEFDLSLEERSFYVAVAQFEPDGLLARTSTEHDRIALMRKLRRHAEQLCESAECKAFAVTMPSHVAILFDVPEPDEGSLVAILSAGDDIRRFADASLRVPVSVAVSNPRTGSAGIAEAYREAVGFLKYKWTLGYRTTINSLSVRRSEPKSLHILARWKSAVVSSLMRYDVAEAEMHLSRLFEALPDSLRQSDAASGLLSMMISEIGLSLKERGHELDTLFEYDLLERIFQLRSQEELLRWFEKELFPAVVSCLNENSLEERRQLVPRVLTYIHTHIEADLSMQKLADFAQVSTTALSRIIKEELGVNYLEYVIDLRMNQAKQWLADTDMPIKEIAQRLQYTTVQNFNRIFKQVTGVTPGKYRKQASVLDENDEQTRDSVKQDRTGTA